MSSYISSPSMSESEHGASQSSCHKISPSVPSCLLVIEHFLNALMMMLLFAFQSMFISIWVSRLEIAEFPDSVRRSAP